MIYYLHDTNAFQDEKIAELFIAHGYEGLGLFYTILERLAAQEKPIKTIVLKRQLGVGKKLEKCWSFMESIGLISSNNGETFNERLVNYLETYAKKRENTKKRVSQHREEQRDTKNVTRYDRVSNAPKEKRIEENKRKKGINIPKEVDPKDEKVNYRTRVSLTVREYETLVGKYGQPFTELCLDKLDFAKQAHSYKYASDYAAINMWVITAVEKDGGKSTGTNSISKAITKRPGASGEAR